MKESVQRVLEIVRTDVQFSNKGLAVPARFCFSRTVQEIGLKVFAHKAAGWCPDEHVKKLARFAQHLQHNPVTMQPAAGPAGPFCMTCCLECTECCCAALVSPHAGFPAQLKPRSSSNPQQQDLQEGEMRLTGIKHGKVLLLYRPEKPNHKVLLIVQDSTSSMQLHIVSMGHPAVQQASPGDSRQGMGAAGAAMLGHQIVLGTVTSHIMDAVFTRPTSMGNYVELRLPSALCLSQFSIQQLPMQVTILLKAVGPGPGQQSAVSLGELQGRITTHRNGNRIDYMLQAGRVPQQLQHLHAHRAISAAAAAGSAVITLSLEAPPTAALAAPPTAAVGAAAAAAGPSPWDTSRKSSTSTSTSGSLLEQALALATMPDADMASLVHGLQPAPDAVQPEEWDELEATLWPVQRDPIALYNVEAGLGNSGHSSGMSTSPAGSNTQQAAIPSLLAQEGEFASQLGAHALTGVKVLCTLSIHRVDVLQGTLVLLGLALAAQGGVLQDVLNQVSAVDLEQYFVAGPNSQQQQQQQQQPVVQQQHGEHEHDSSSGATPVISGTGSVGVVCLNSGGGIDAAVNIIPKQSFTAMVEQQGISKLFTAPHGLQQLVTDAPLLQQLQSSVAGGSLDRKAALASQFALGTSKGSCINKAVLRNTLQAASSSPQCTAFVGQQQLLQVVTEVLNRKCALHFSSSSCDTRWLAQGEVAAGTGTSGSFVQQDMLPAAVNMYQTIRVLCNVGLLAVIMCNQSAKM